MATELDSLTANSNLFVGGIRVSDAEELLSLSSELPLHPLLLTVMLQGRVLLLAESDLQVEQVRLLASLSDDQNLVTVTADVVGWDYVPHLDPDRYCLLDRLFATLQPVGHRKFVQALHHKHRKGNVLHVRNFRRLDLPVPVTSLTNRFGDPVKAIDRLVDRFAYVGQW